jgi:hypothetical protein
MKAFCCDPAEARTLDPQIKSLLLYQLSYGVRSGSKCMTIKKPEKELPVFLKTCFHSHKIVRKQFAFCKFICMCGKNDCFQNGRISFKSI